MSDNSKDRTRKPSVHCPLSNNGPAHQTSQCHSNNHLLNLNAERSNLVVLTARRPRSPLDTSAGALARGNGADAILLGVRCARNARSMLSRGELTAIYMSCRGRGAEVGRLARG